MTPLLRDGSDSPTWEIREGDALERLREMPDESVQCCVTSPPYYGLRDYGVDGQIGLEPTMEEFIAKLVAVFDEVRRVLRSDGTLWLNLGDTFSGGRNGKPGMTTDVRHRGRTRGWLPPHAAGGTGLANKQLCGVPWRVALALQAEGWWLRSDIIWHKPTPMPEAVSDRPTRAHEYLFLLTRSPRYFYDADAIRMPLAAKTLTTFGTQRNGYGGGDLVKADNWARDVPERQPRVDSNGEPVGANKPSVWTVASQPFPEAHFATFPPKLIEPCVLAGAAAGAVVLDPFAGSGTTGVVALRHGRGFVGIELNSTYAEMARERIRRDAPLLNTTAEVAA